MFTYFLKFWEITVSNPYQTCYLGRILVHQLFVHCLGSMNGTDRSPKTEYSGLTVVKLRQQLKNRGLSQKGNKAALVGLFWWLLSVVDLNLA